MSRYQVALIRAGLVYLVATGLLGTLFFAWPRLLGQWRVVHVHLGLVGFFLSLVMGVAFWLMPRPGGMRQARAEAIVFYLLNVGLLLRVVAEPLWRGGTHGALLVVSGALQLGAMLVFAGAMFRRVRTKEALWAARKGREAKLER